MLKSVLPRDKTDLLFWDAGFASSHCTFCIGFARILRFRCKPSKSRSPNLRRFHCISCSLDDKGFDLLEFSYGNRGCRMVGCGEFCYCTSDAVLLGRFRMGISRKRADTEAKGRNPVCPKPDFNSGGIEWNTLAFGRF
jgi:hypothetical protein